MLRGIGDFVAFKGLSRDVVGRFRFSLMVSVFKELKIELKKRKRDRFRDRLRERRILTLIEGTLIGKRNNDSSIMEPLPLK